MLHFYNVLEIERKINLSTLVFKNILNAMSESINSRISELIMQVIYYRGIEENTFGK